ncbi:MAG TPA: polysaccharide lyase family protein [Phycisphaerae bacterium]|nr:polysaccharide lyase family protein [Phycisphaerae bacterium]
MKTSHTLSLLLAAAAFLAAAPARAADPVQLTMNGQPAKTGDYTCDDIKSLVISNGLVSLTFGKDSLGDFSATSVKKGDEELGHNLNGVNPRDVDRLRTFYYEYGASRGRLWATQIKIIKAAPDFVHFAVIDDGKGNGGYSDKPADAPGLQAGARGRLALEEHFVMLPGVSGIYSYAIVNTPNAGGEMRTMYRFDRSILDHAWTVEHVGVQPTYAALEKMPKLQDETWQLPDGAIYQKYDYVDYFSESPMWGHFGHGYGAWFIPVSTEYYAGGPYREELIVHQDALILNYLGGGHFGGGGAATTGKPKMFGPWLVYLNNAPSQDALVADAKRQAADEQAKWPYQWVDEPLYPTQRTTVTGKLHLTDPGEHQTAANAWVCLAKPGDDVYRQSGDFIFYTKADENGNFTLPHVRAGSYALYAWPREGSITDALEKDGITVKDGQGTMDLGAVDWKTTKHNQFLWQIGKSDRLAQEFKFGDQPRNVKWIEQVPADLTFTIGKSKDDDDWYFAQGKVGHWDINFDLAKPVGANAYLTIAIAGGGGGPRMQPEVNGQKVGQPIAPPNDSATYRSSNRSGVYHLQTITFPGNLLKQGQNTVRLDMTQNGGRWHGLMYDTIILEAD